MDPLILSSLIGAGSSLLGGIFGKPKQVSARTNSRQGILGQAQGAREAAEKYGFNPLTLLGVSSPLGPSERSNYMGNAIAEAGLMLADGVAKRGEKAGLLSKLEAQNEELREQVQSLTLRPKVGGIYAQREAVPAIGGSSDVLGLRAVLSGGAGADDGSGGADGASGGLRPLSATLPIDPRREVDNEELRTSSGFMTIDNPYAPWPLYFPTIDGDEALQWYDLPTLGVGIAGNALFRAGQAAGERRDIARENARGNPVYRMEDGRLYAPYPAPQPPRAPSYPLSINPQTGRFGQNPAPPSRSLPALPRWRP